jgi:hypothetical protein
MPAVKKKKKKRAKAKRSIYPTRHAAKWRLAGLRANSKSIRDTFDHHLTDLERTSLLNVEARLDRSNGLLV